MHTNITNLGRKRWNPTMQTLRRQEQVYCQDVDARTRLESLHWGRVARSGLPKRNTTVSHSRRDEEWTTHSQGGQVEQRSRRTETRSRQAGWFGIELTGKADLCSLWAQHTFIFLNNTFLFKFKFLLFHLVYFFALKRIKKRINLAKISECKTITTKMFPLFNWILLYKLLCFESSFTQ